MKQVKLRSIVTLLGIVLLIFLYGFFFTSIPDRQVRYALLFSLAFVLVLGGPMYAYVRYRQHMHGPTLVMRILVAVIFIITGFPIITVAGLLFGALFLASGFSFVFQGQIVRGLLEIVVWAFAIYGLVTLWSLARHYWNNPSQNPVGAQLKRNLVGLAMGFLAVVVLLTPAFVGRGSDSAMISLSALFTVPAALFFSLILGWNHLRKHKSKHHLPSS